MPGIDANMNRVLAQQVVDLYNQAENDILLKIAKRLEIGVDVPGWERRKLRQVQEMRDDVMEQIAILDLKMPPNVNGTVAKAYTAGKNSIDTDLINQDLLKLEKGELIPTKAFGNVEPGVGIAFGKIDKRKIEEKKTPAKVEG